MIKSDPPIARPSTSINGERPPLVEDSAKKLSSTYNFGRFTGKNSSFLKNYVSTAFDDFGTSTPHWTIPSSRKDPPPPIETPGPGQYQYSTIEKDSKIPHVISNKEERKYESITSTIDYIDVRVFPKIRPVSMGHITGKHFYDQPETPPPTYSPPSTLGKTVAIRQKHPEKEKDPIPGPASYSPQDPQRRSSPCFSFSKTKSRMLPIEKSDDIPGPGAYNVTPTLRKAPRWTEKLRVKPKQFTRPHGDYDRPWSVK